MRGFTKFGTSQILFKSIPDNCCQTSKWFLPTTPVLPNLQFGVKYELKLTLVKLGTFVKVKTCAKPFALDCLFKNILFFIEAIVAFGDTIKVKHAEKGAIDVPKA